MMESRNIVLVSLLAAGAIVSTIVAGAVAAADNPAGGRAFVRAMTPKEMRKLQPIGPASSIPILASGNSTTDGLSVVLVDCPQSNGIDFDSGCQSEALGMSIRGYTLGVPMNEQDAEAVFAARPDLKAAYDAALKACMSRTESCHDDVRDRE